MELQDAVTRCFEILDRYYFALEDDTTQDIVPQLSYEWQFFNQPVTIDWIDKMLAALDDYWWAQHGWSGLRDVNPEAGPDLSRLPDGAKWALFQELDTLATQSEPDVTTGEDA